MINRLPHTPKQTEGGRNERKIPRAVMASRSYLFFVIFIFHGVFFIDRRVSGHKVITVASYNIWNVMFQWETRKQYIAEMVSLI